MRSTATQLSSALVLAMAACACGELAPPLEAGAPCTRDDECGPDGTCREATVVPAEGEDAIVFPEGSCSGPPCFADADCRGRGRCGGARAGAFLTGGQNTCLAPCDLSEGADPGDPATWPRGRGGCAEGYKCLSDSGVGSPGRGVCVPERLDPFRDAPTVLAPFGAGPDAPNLAAACRRNDECFHPFGYGRCLIGANGRDGVCTVDEAGLLELSGYDVCRAPGTVVALPGSRAFEQRCLVRCEAAAECAEGFACVERGAGRVCDARGCTGDAECREGARCLEGACHTPCSDAAECGAGLACVPLRALGGSADEGVCFAGCQRSADCAGEARCAGATADALGRCVAS